jgi:uncharacterized protein (TIRG00374 family)
VAQRQRIGDRVEHAIERRAEAPPEVRAGAEVEAGEGRPSLRRTVIWLTITGISLYLVAPSLLDVLGSWRDVTRLEPMWLPVMLVLQTASFACLWDLQRVEAVSGITAVNLLVFGVVLGLPVLALPAIVRGTVTRNLVETALVGLLVFAALAGLTSAALAFDAPLAWVGRALQRLRNRLRRDAEPVRRLPERLLAERDLILHALGPRWHRAVLMAVGRWAFDYATLLAALAAVDSHPRPVLVLLAFCAAQVLAQIPVTPGGLGFVEAGLTALLALAGVHGGDAVLATFSYRLFNYWLPLPAGLAAYVAFRRRRVAAAGG